MATIASIPYTTPQRTSKENKGKAVRFRSILSITFRLRQQAYLK